MFLVNKDGNYILKVNGVEMCLQYDKSVSEEADKIYNRVMAKCYNYGSTENAKREAGRRVKEFVSDRQPICRILVNDKVCFGDYDEVQGKIVFEEIIGALRNGESFFDMREIQFVEGFNANKER